MGLMGDVFASAPIGPICPIYCAKFCILHSAFNPACAGFSSLRLGVAQISLPSALAPLRRFSFLVFFSPSNLCIRGAANGNENCILMGCEIYVKFYIK